MPLFDVKVTTWVTVKAKNEIDAQNKVQDGIRNGDFGEDYQEASYVGDTMLSEDQNQI